MKYIKIIRLFIGTILRLVFKTFFIFNWYFLFFSAGGILFFINYHVLLSSFTQASQIMITLGTSHLWFIEPKTLVAQVSIRIWTLRPFFLHKGKESFQVLVWLILFDLGFFDDVEGLWNADVFDCLDYESLFGFSGLHRNVVM
jgi:hypothetical protein